MEQKYKLERHIGILSEGNGGWTKEINIVSWFGKVGKFDIRDWGPDHEKIGKGVTLDEDELLKLYDFLKDYFDGESTGQQNESEGCKDLDELFFK